MWVFPKIVVPPFHTPKWSFLVGKPHGCWGNPPFLATSMDRWNFGWISHWFCWFFFQVEEVFNELDAWAAHSMVNGEIGLMCFWGGSVQDQDKDYRFYYLSNSRDWRYVLFLEMVEFRWFWASGTLFSMTVEKNCKSPSRVDPNWWFDN